MIIPIGHEENTVRRQPWVTYTLMLACIAVFIPTHYSTQAQFREGFERLEEAVEFYVERPYLELDPRLEEIVYGLPELDGEDAYTDEEFTAWEQPQLDDLTERGFEVFRATALRHWGLVPGDISPVSFVTYMFLHSGWFHLLGNLLFLYLAGPFVEDVWGRGMFTGFYLVAGVAAAGLFVLRFPQLDGPLIGASGAIAGVMGAFCVRHWNKKIRFFYWIGFIFRGTFSSPAWVILPLWFARELSSARTMEVLLPGSGGGVAYWAHVGGFAFGVVVAVALRFSGWEERVVETALDRKDTVVDNSCLEKVLEAKGQGRMEDAWTLASKEVRRNPTNVDAADVLWSLALELGRAAQAAPSMLRVLREEMRQGEAVLAYMRWRDVGQHLPDLAMDAAVEVKLAELLLANEQHDEARDVVSAAASHASPETPSAVLLRLARLAEGPDKSRVAALALSQKALPPEVRRELQDMAGASSPRGGAAAVGSSIPLASDGAASILRAHRGVPIALQGAKLLVNLEGKGRGPLSLDRVKAVAAASIRSSSPRPLLLLDLFLDDPRTQNSPPRTVRFEDSRFDPCSLFPSSESVEDGFRKLVNALVEASGAVTIPGPDAVRGSPLSSYASMEAYEGFILAMGASAGDGA